MQPFKIGPDFIDPSYHSVVSGRRSRNLDSFMLNKRSLTRIFCRASSDADISIIEGVMGLFDGLNGFRASTYEVARIMDAPVVLVADAWNSSVSLAAQLIGYKSMGHRVAGVILNRVAGESHARICESAIRRYANLKVVGAIPNDGQMTLEERHLGLVPTAEKDRRGEIDRIVQVVAEHVDLDALVKTANSAPPIEYKPSPNYVRTPMLRIGVALDEAFNFYYADALQLLEENGLEIHYFSPLHDNHIPDSCSALYIGGGFPEAHSELLEKNSGMRRSVARAAAQGMPILAECGGMMYLARSLRDMGGRVHKMVGLFELDVEMTHRLTISYILSQAIRDSILLERGRKVRGHEFHRSAATNLPRDASFAYKMVKGEGFGNGMDGIMAYETLATYHHTHLASNPNMALRFASRTKAYSRK